MGILDTVKNWFGKGRAEEKSVKTPLNSITLEKIKAHAPKLVESESAPVPKKRTTRTTKK